MCIAILNKKNMLPDDYIKNSWDNNNQGAGMLYVLSGKLQTFKTYDFKEFKKTYKEIRKKIDSPIVLHFRIATSGFQKYVNLHPFLVDDNLGFVHNGVIYGLGNKDYSDTYEFNELYLKKLPKDFLKNEGIVSLIQSYIDTSKLIFLSSDNTYNIINEGLGVWDNDNWLSNTSYLQTNDFYYFGNKKVKKGKNVNTFNDFDCYNNINEDEMMKMENITYIYQYYDGVNDNAINDIVSHAGLSLSDYDFCNNLEEIAYNYGTYNITDLAKKIKDDYRKLYYDKIPY